MDSLEHCSFEVQIHKSTYTTGMHLKCTFRKDFVDCRLGISQGEWIMTIENKVYIERVEPFVPTAQFSA